ncbi:hypothetical protein FPCIR_1130 [Fusarium pseudocircinatum]|uniref:BTB domain-containing protein n=1 Tax=Fusarium pseudocircinatum TaxID=56676 RepID=A0A8H5PVE3_9HYPO|nr:hypothetical protein FPCIR_1130 [Fusarium pseudocircinatum]
MKPSLLVFAPKGDTDLILRKPNFRSHQESLPPAADPNVGAEENDEHGEQELQDDQNEPQLHVAEEFNDVTASIESLNHLKNLKPSNENKQNVKLRYRVLSAHLMLVSPVFKAMLDGPFREGSYLPLPSIILDSIEKRRQALTQSFLNNIYALLNSFWYSDGGCHTECTAMMLGMLIKQMLRFGLEVPKATGRPAIEKSFSQLRDFSGNLKSPLWVGRDDYEDHECTFEDITGPWLVEIDKVDVCSGVRFESFRSKDSKSEARLTKKERKKRKRDRYLS